MSVMRSVRRIAPDFIITIRIRIIITFVALTTDDTHFCNDRS